MPDYLNRMINEALRLPNNVALVSVDFDDQGRYWITSDGRLLSVCREQARYKQFTDNGSGYYYVDINNKREYLHRLLGIAFNQSQEKKRMLGDCVVHHLDRNKENNQLPNLCVLTKEKHQAIHNIWRKIDCWEIVPWD